MKAATFSLRVHTSQYIFANIFKVSPQFRIMFVAFDVFYMFTFQPYRRCFFNLRLFYRQCGGFMKLRCLFDRARRDHSEAIIKSSRASANNLQSVELTFFSDTDRLVPAKLTMLMFSGRLRKRKKSMQNIRRKLFLQAKNEFSSHRVSIFQS